VTYLMSKGIKIDVYSPGNEIGTGILNFRPGERIPAPAAGSPYDAVDYMEQNVWPIEAQLLKAAISGIRRADPDAKIVLHIAGFELAPANVWAQAFFSTMVNLGVPFDAAGVSHPYMSPGWKLPQYTTGCWYQRVDSLFRGFAALGKKGIISEGAYNNTAVNLSANEPMMDFPITPQGQAGWISALLRFAASNPNIFGFNYTFPETIPGVLGPNPPPDVESFSLFTSATQTQPGMLAFNPFIGTRKAPRLDAVVNTAVSQSGPLIPGQTATAYGANLAGFNLSAQPPYLPVLGSVAVKVNGQNALVQSVSNTQVNFQVPYGITPGAATVIVSAGLQDSAPFTVQVQAGSGTSPLAVSPASGSGFSQNMTFTFTDPRGLQDLNVVNVLINSALDGGHACYLAYSVPAGALYLVTDDGASLLTLSLNRSGSVQNSQCTVNGAGSSATGTGDGNVLTLVVNTNFTPAFAGNKVIYMAARDQQGGNSGWVAEGVWNVPGKSTNPAPVSVTPASGQGLTKTFTFMFTDTKGVGDLGVQNVLINSALDGGHACYLAYSEQYNLLFLVNDTATGTTVGIPPGGTGSISNSQCTVNAAGSSAITSGNNVTLTLNMSFAPTFGGHRIIYMASRDATDANNSGWQAMGTWTVQ
jgi:uncharacterized protein (TIGR03437 family)